MENKFFLKESDLRHIVENAVNKIISEYKMMDIDELMEYMWLRPSDTGLRLDVFVDDGGSYLRNNHPLLVFIRNGYAKSDNEFIPMSVEDKPRVLDDDMDFYVSYNDIFEVQDFIQNNRELLIKLANNEMKQFDFKREIKPQKGIMVAEQRQSLKEMATLKATDSGLPMDIWLDEGATYMGHAPRIKFKASNEQRTTREFSSMLLTKDATVENFPSNSPIRKKDMEKLKTFVIDNLDLLLDLANGKIKYDESFMDSLIIPN